MKNFVKHTLAIAICAVALLSSCIKEESYVTQDVILDVQLTRAGTTSEQQGDQIEDIMLWAFELNGDGVVINNNPVGWRQFKAPNPTFTQLSLHLPVKMCGTDGAKYRIIAVLNTQKFTDVNGNAISFNGTTTYTALTTGKFVSKGVMDSAIEENKPGTPAVMPVSHWADVEVAQSNVHDSNPHASVSIDVFRTVAKTQFFMAGKSGAKFDLEVTELSLHCGAMPTDGLILSSLAPDALKNKDTTPDWFGESEPTIVGDNATDAEKTITLVAADAADVAVDGEAYFHENRPVIADGETAANHYKLIGSHFLYENPDGFTFTDNATSAPEGDGYYYKIVYKADNQPHTRYVALPSILRNHDYQIHALVEGGSGELTFTIEVNQWTVEEEIIDYTNIVTVTEQGRMMWTQLPDAKQVPSGYTQNTDGYILDSEDKTVGVVPVTTDNNGVINMTEYGDAYATCTFALSTPVGGTWYAVLETVSGDDVDAFEIVEADSGAADDVVADGLKTTHTPTSASGPISPIDANGKPVTGVVTLKFKTKADNETLKPNQAVLKITAKGFWGGKERVYEVVNLTGLKDANGKDLNYSLRQPVKAL